MSTEADNGVEGGVCPCCEKDCYLEPGVSCVKLNCRHCGVLYAHHDCHVKRVKAVMTCVAMAKQGHACNFPCHRSGCPGKVKSICWLEGKRNEKKREARIQAAINSAQYGRKPLKPGHPPPGLSGNELQDREDGSCQNNIVANKPCPQGSRGLHKASLIEQQQPVAGAQELLNRVVAERSRQFATTPAPLPPAGAGSKPARVTVKALKQVVSAPGQGVAARLGTGATGPAPRRADLADFIPGAEFVEPPQGKPRSRSKKQVASQGSSNGGATKAGPPASLAGPTRGQRQQQQQVAGNGNVSKGHGFGMLAHDAMSSAMKQLEGVVTDADAYKQLLASLGMGLDDDSDLCSEDDEEEEGEEEEETQLFAKSSAAEVETGTNPGLWQVVGGAKPIAGEAAATADVDFGAADVWGQAPSALQAPSPTSLHSATSQLSSPSPHASNSTPKLLYGSDVGQVPAAAAPLQPQGLPAAKRVVLSGADFQLVSQVEDWLMARGSCDPDGVAWFRAGSTWTAIMPGDDGSMEQVEGLPHCLFELYRTAQLQTSLPAATHASTTPAPAFSQPSYAAAPPPPPPPPPHFPAQPPLDVWAPAAPVPAPAACAPTFPLVMGMAPAALDPPVLFPQPHSTGALVKGQLDIAVQAKQAPDADEVDIDELMDMLGVS